MQKMIQTLQEEKKPHKYFVSIGKNKAKVWEIEPRFWLYPKYRMDKKYAEAVGRLLDEEETAKFFERKRDRNVAVHHEYSAFKK